MPPAISLAFHHHGPALEPAVAVPPASVQPPDYGLVYDPARRALVYVTAPDYHQCGMAWTFDGASFTPVSTTTYRLGSQQGPWTSVYDAARGAVVAWGFDHDSGPYGIVIGASLSVILHERAREDHARMEQPATAIVVAGDAPGLDEDFERSWDDLHGVFGYDPSRRATVCVGQEGIFEIASDRWAKVAPAPAQLPKSASGDRKFSGGAGAVWDARAGELVFWFIDTDEDVVVFGAWNGKAWTAMPADGLPELWAGYGETGFAVGDHPQHGIVIYAGPEHGLYGRTKAGFAKVADGDGGPARGKGGQLVWDPARGVLVLGPFVNRAGTQNVFHAWTADGTWRRIGATTTPAPFGELSSGFQAFGRHRGAMHAVGLYLKTVAWDPAVGWRWLVDDKQGDAQREGGYVQAIATAWDGVLHAVLADGGVLAFDDRAWHRVAPASSVFDEVRFALVEFDPVRGVIVAWGPGKKGRGRKNETYTFDGKAWTKVKAKAKPADLAAKDAEFTLFWDGKAQQVARLGVTELAHFDGKDWVATKLSGGKLQMWRRAVCCDPVSGAIVVVNIGDRTVVRVRGGKVEPVGTFTDPLAKDGGRSSNLPFDRWWFDEPALALVVHADHDTAQTFALDLRAAFSA